AGKPLHGVAARRGPAAGPHCRTRRAAGAARRRDRPPRWCAGRGGGIGMAIQPDTTTGTITLASGSVTFTTSGTNLQTREHRPGDTIHRNGFTLVIPTITGQNSGT